MCAGFMQESLNVKPCEARLWPMMYEEEVLRIVRKPVLKAGDVEAHVCSSKLGDAMDMDSEGNFIIWASID